MFEEFSGGYYLGQLYVEPHDGTQAVMQAEEHERANRTVYANGEGIERLDNPLVVKLDEAHFPVHGAAGIPSGTLAIPRELLARTRIDELPALREVLLAKKAHAAQFLRLFGGGPGDCGAPP